MVNGFYLWSGDQGVGLVQKASLTQSLVACINPKSELMAIKYIKIGVKMMYATQT